MVVKPQTAAAWRPDGAIPQLVPVRMLNEFAYCPRLAYLEWVQGEFEDNADTIQGRNRHRRVDRESGGADKQMEAAGADDVIHARSLMLSAEGEGLIARMDIVEFEGNKATPVDYKRGAMPDIPERVWEPERVQLCAQGLILRENGYECDEGVVYFVESRTRVTVPFDEELIHRTRTFLAELRDTAGAGVLPPPLEDSPKCPRCSLVGICLPDETLLLQQMSADDDSKNGSVTSANGREPSLRRRDPVNALLSFAYSLLTKDALVALSATGFDPYLGVYHAPKYGKPALALDLVEEFRPIIADSVVIGAINNEEVTPDDFIRRAGGVALKDEARRRFIAAYERRMGSTITHPLFGYTISYRRVLAVQARLLARAITGEIASYPTFATR